MGLSNQERFMKLVHSINRMQKFIPDLKIGEKAVYRASNISELISRMWAELLSKNGDGGFWIFGSQMRNQHLDPNNLFHVAMVGHADEVVATVREELDKASGWKITKDSDGYDDYEYASQFFPSIDDIISHSHFGRYYPTIIKILHEIELCQYALNRYDDEFSDSFKGIRDLCAEIQGRCFSIVSSDKVFYEAYLLDVIFQKISCGHWDSKDNIVLALCKKFNLHHYWHVKNRNEFELARLMTIWKNIQNGNPSNEEKVIILLTIGGSCFGSYTHLVKELMDCLREWNEKKTSTQRVRLNKLTPTISYLQKEYKKKNREEEKQYREEKYCWTMSSFELTEKEIKQAENYRNKKS